MQFVIRVFSGFLNSSWAGLVTQATDLLSPCSHGRRSSCEGPRPLSVPGTAFCASPRHATAPCLVAATLALSERVPKAQKTRHFKTVPNRASGKLEHPRVPLHELTCAHPCPRRRRHPSPGAPAASCNKPSSPRWGCPCQSQHHMPLRASLKTVASICP